MFGMTTVSTSSLQLNVDSSGGGSTAGAVVAPPNERSMSTYVASAGTPAGRGAGVAGVRDACAVVEPPVVLCAGEEPPEHAVASNRVAAQPGASHDAHLISSILQPAV
jgi:hypothetical protein